MRWLFLLVLPLVCGFQITEIMYDPEGQDNNREYIELFTNESNVSDILFEDLVSSDTLELLQFFEGDYALIVEEGFQRNDLNVTMYSVGATIGNGLNNNRDLVLFRTNDSILDAYFYAGERDGGKNNGKSLCRQGDMFLECSPTPGLENDFNQTQENITYTLSISEFLPNPEGDDEAPWPGGEWVELYNYGDQPLSLLGLTLVDAANHSVIISDVHVNPSVLEPQQYAVVSLQTLLLNNEGLETLVLQSPTEVLDILTYSDSREEVSWSKDFEQDRFSLALPTPGQRHHTEKTALNSSLVLERVYVGNDDVVKFGESFRVRLHAHKGDTTKTTIKLYVANLSKQTTVSIEEKFVDHTFTLTIPLDPNCKKTYADGTYTVVAEGFDLRTEIPVTVQGISRTSCQVLPEERKENVSSKLKSSTTTSLLSPITADTFINATGRVVYETSDYQAKRWAVYFFCLTLLLVIAALVTRH